MQASTSTAASARTRHLREGDLPQIAAIFQSVFRHGAPLSLDAVIEHLRAIYLDGPWFDPEIGSVVHLADDGRIDGFWGSIAVPMLWRGRPIRAAVTGTLMVARDAKDPRAGLRLVRAHSRGPQEMTFCDTANRRSMDLAPHLGFTVIAGSSLEWCRILRPGGLAQEMLRARGRPGLARFGQFAAGFVDRRWQRGASRAAGADAAGASDTAAFIQNAATLVDGFMLRPQWDALGLAWQLRLAAMKQAWGPLYLREVRARSGRLEGIYAYYGGCGRTAVVLQVLAIAGATLRVIEDLCSHATATGCVAVRGQTHPSLMEGLFRMPRVFYRHRDAAIIHARDPAMIAAAISGAALVGGLVGDTWVRLGSDSFETAAQSTLRSQSSKTRSGNFQDRAK